MVELQQKGDGTDTSYRAKRLLKPALVGVLGRREVGGEALSGEVDIALTIDRESTRVYVLGLVAADERSKDHSRRIRVELYDKEIERNVWRDMVEARVICIGCRREIGRPCLPHDYDIPVLVNGNPISPVTVGTSQIGREEQGTSTAVELADKGIGCTPTPVGRLSDHSRRCWENTCRMPCNENLSGRVDRDIRAHPVSTMPTGGGGTD